MSATALRNWLERMVHAARAHPSGRTPLDCPLSPAGSTRASSKNPPESLCACRASRAAIAVGDSPDDVIVASSADLGVTYGMIQIKGQPAGVPYVTIWRRRGPGEVWRYVAE